jgi:hypothetical protein
MFLLYGQSELIMDIIDKDVLEVFMGLVKQNLTPSQIMRRIVAEFGEISPPDMAQYFNIVYSLPAIEFTLILGEWWPDSSSPLSDEDFDRRIFRIIHKIRQ